MNERLSGADLQRQILSSVARGVQGLSPRRGSLVTHEIVFPHIVIDQDEAMSRVLLAGPSAPKLTAILVPDRNQILNPACTLVAAIKTVSVSESRVPAASGRLYSTELSFYSGPREEPKVPKAMLALSLRDVVGRGPTIYLPLPSPSELVGSKTVCVDGNCYVGQNNEAKNPVTSEPLALGTEADGDNVLLLVSRLSGQPSSLSRFDLLQPDDFNWLVSSVKLPRGWEQVLIGTTLKEFPQGSGVKEYSEGANDKSYKKRSYNSNSSKNGKSAPRKAGVNRQARMATTSEKKRANNWKQR